MSKSKSNSNAKPVKAIIVEKKVELPKSINIFDDVLGSKTFFVLLVILGVLATWSYGSFWFTDKVFLFKDIGSDTINGMFPTYYSNAKNWEQEGSFPLWTFDTGIGQNIMVMNLGDPFMWFVYFMGKDSIIHLLGIIEPLKVVLAGITFYFYLRILQMSYFSSLVGAICFAFSGFMMIGSGWMVFTIEGLYFALLLLTFELYLKKGIWFLFPIVICLIGLWIPVDVYLMAVLVATYGVIRILDENNFNWIDLVKRLSFLAFLGIIGILMGAVLILPTLDLMINSPRVLGGSSFFDTLSSKSAFEMTNPDLLSTTKARWVSTDLLKDDKFFFRGSMNYLEAPVFFAGLPLFVLVPMAFQLMQKKERIFYGILLGLFLLPAFFPFFRYAFWLFTGDYYRMYSLFVIFVMVLLSVNALNKLLKSEKFPWIGFVTGVAIMYYLIFSVKNSQIVLVNEVARNFLVMFTMAYLTCIAMMSNNSFKDKAIVFFLFVLIIELGSTSYSTLNKRTVATAAEFEKDKIGYNDYSRDAVKWIKAKDSTYFRIEKNYASYDNKLILHSSTNDAKAQDYWGTKSYSSFNHLNYVSFLSNMNIINEKDENQTRWIAGVGMRPMVNFLLGNKYFLSKQGKDVQLGFGYVYKHTIGDVSIFENPNYVPFGASYDKVIKRSDFDKLDKTLVQNIYGKKDIALLKACVVEDEDLKKVDMPIFNVDTINAQNYPFEALINDTKILREDAFQMTKFKNDHFKGKITIRDKKKIVFFAMPKDKGWKVLVDDKVSDILKVNIGFAGVLLNPGEHTIEMIYHTPYFSTGMWISLGTILFFAAMIGISFWFNSKKDKLKEDVIAESNN